MREYTFYLEPSYWPLEPSKCIKFNSQQIVIEYKEFNSTFRAQVFGHDLWQALNRAFWAIYFLENEGD